MLEKHKGIVVSSHFFRSKITIALHQNGQLLQGALAERFVANGVVQTITLVALLNVAKWDVFELKIGSDSPSSTTLMAGSTFSVLQLGEI